MMLNAPCFKQPSPNRNPGGDCFACALKNVVDYFYPENPIPFDTAWECWQETQGCSRVECGADKTKKHLRNHWGGLYGTLQNLHAAGWKMDWEIDIVHPEINEDRFSYNFGWQVPAMKWSRRVQNWLAGGWLLIADISLESVDHNMRNQYGGSDHFIVIDGQREFWLRHYDAEGKPSGGTGKEETHVVCSAKGPYWIDTRDFIHYHGVNGFFAVRREDVCSHVYRDYSWNESPENQAKIKD